MSASSSTRRPGRSATYPALPTTASLDRPAAVLGRRMLVVRERAAVAQRAQVVRELLPGRVEVEVAHVGVAPVPEPVDDERRHASERPRRHEHLLVLEPEPDGELAVEDVEEVGVVPVDVEVGADAVSAPPRPRRAERLDVGQDLDPPMGASPISSPSPNGMTTTSPTGRQPSAARLCRAALPLGVLVPRRRVAPGGARRSGRSSSGYPALALTDHDGVYGSLEFAHAATYAGLRPITGAEVTLEGGQHVTLLCESGKGYANLCRILTAAHAGTSPKGKEHRVLLPPAAPLETVAELNEGLVCLSGCARDGLALHDPHGAARLAAAFGRERFFVELQRPYERGDARRHAALRDLAEHLGVETIATGNVHAHSRQRTLLQDALVAIRSCTSLDGCERERRGNREAVLRSPGEMVERFAGIDRAAAERTVACSRSAWRSTSPRSSAIATRTSPTAPTRRSRQLARDLRPRVRRAVRRCSDSLLRARSARPPRERARS